MDAMTPPVLAFRCEAENSPWITWPLCSTLRLCARGRRSQGSGRTRVRGHKTCADGSTRVQPLSPDKSTVLLWPLL